VYLINLIGIYIIALFGLQIMMGYAGQISMGHAAFMAVGAYTSGLVSNELGFPFWVALPSAALITGIVGVIFGFSSLRLRGFYLVVSTLAAQIIIIWVLLWQSDITGGDTGLVVDSPRIGSFVFDTQSKYYFIIFFCLILGTYLMSNMMRTKIGRALIAVRDNDLAANVLGIRPSTTKLLAFFIGCSYAGVAGSLWAHWMGSINPAQFHLWLSIWFIGYIIIGGVGSISGCYFGVILIMVLNNVLSEVSIAIDVVAPQITFFLLYGRDLLFGVIIVLVLIFEPRGLAHRWEIVRAYFRLWPFKE